MLEFLSGKKTYIVAAAAILTAAGAFASGTMNAKELVEAIMAALGVSFLRAGVAKVEDKLDEKKP